MKMKLTKANILLISIICICILALSMTCMTPNMVRAEGMADGKYKVTFDKLSDMMMMAFENSANEVIVEKVGNYYFMTVSFYTNMVDNIRLLSDSGRVGEVVERDGMIERHTYTLSEANINKSIEFSVFINQMKTDKTLSITPKLSTAVKVGEIEDIGDRPAEYVPVIDVAISDVEMEKGSMYLLPTATAKLGDEELPVIVSATYTKDGINEDIVINGNKLMLDNVGEYHIVYRAESEKYKTLLGSNTFAEVHATITSKVGASSLAKIVDKNNILPANCAVMANYVTSGEIFDKAIAVMKNIADRYEVIDINIINGSGESVKPTEAIDLYIRANDAFNRNSLEVYILNDDGTIAKQEIKGFGRYILLNTQNTGTYIICQPGVEFHMPMWGYALITVFGVLIIISIVAVIVFYVVRKKKNTTKVGR